MHLSTDASASVIVSSISGTETSATRSYYAKVLDGWKENWATNANPFIHLSEFNLFRVSSRSLK
jgi:hypothetical protein